MTRALGRRAKIAQHKSLDKDEDENRQRYSFANIVWFASVLRIKRLGGFMQNTTAVMTPSLADTVKAYMILIAEMKVKGKGGARLERHPLQDHTRDRGVPAREERER
ncbi:hypothetical protein A0H81_11051 [Grifola frondosa]|uniref:Uncharacterized protein n=1 Tax=Grifola frondosa TaxID=5627 RepID=A0A1C7LXT2_GRIFR|nr:hypothetical protein A0H81_11051 [Grifola frondosa]